MALRRLAGCTTAIGMLAPLVVVWSQLHSVSAAGIAPLRNTELLAALSEARTEEAAKALMEPHAAELKKLDPGVVEYIVSRQWWELSTSLVAKSHEQGVDLSFSVRKAVRVMKDESDELLRTLNPKYGQAQQVAPAFQWAQNDTCIFLTVKYTVRWNAPGALEVSEPSVNMSGNSFNFSGLGKHSNNKYRYYLSLSMFDMIDSARSTWSAASVGKMSVTFRKKWTRKWPRLLANKKTKIGNMHTWMDQQEKLDSTLKGLTTASNSPVTCALIDKLYCLATDTCKKADACSQCPGKTTPSLEENVCTGMPNERASVTFKDADMDEGEIGGDVVISKAKNEFDIDSYQVYYGKDERSKLEPPLSSFIGEATPRSDDVHVRIPLNTQMPETATHLLVFSKNSFGEHTVPGNVMIKDAVLPKGRSAGLSFSDEDGEKGELSGTITIKKAEDETRIDEYVLHWGKSATKKIASGSHIRDVTKQAGKDVTHYLARSTKIPAGATHFIVIAKNEFGENNLPVSLKFVDNTKPCLSKDDADCPAGISASPDADPDAGKAETTLTVSAGRAPVDIETYSFYWGRQACGPEGGQNGAKNGFIKDLAASEASLVLEKGTVVPAGSTHVLVFSKNKYGESDHCVSTSFEDQGAPAAAAAAAGKTEL